MRGHYERTLSELEHDVVLLDTVSDGVHIRQIEGREFRITIDGDSKPWPWLFLRGDLMEAAELLERAARALRGLP